MDRHDSISSDSQLTLSHPASSIPPNLSHSPLITVNSDVLAPSTPTGLSFSPPAPSTESVQRMAVFSQPPVDKPKWSIVYNTGIERTLDITFEHAFEHPFEVAAVRFSPDSSLLAAAFFNNPGTRIYDVKTKSMKWYVHIISLAEFVIRCFVFSLLKEHPGYVVKKTPLSVMRSLCFNPDGRYLVVGDILWPSGAFCDIWEVASKRVLARFKLYAHSVDVSPDGRLFVAASFGSVCIRKMRDGSSKFLWTGTRSSYTTTKFSPNGQYVAASIIGEHVRIWNVRSGQLVGKWNAQQLIWSIAFSPDGAELMSGGWDGTMKSWDVSSLQTINGRIDEKDILVPNKKLEFWGHSVCWSCFDNALLTYPCVGHREVDRYLA
jgi:hypothetical protein